MISNNFNMPNFNFNTNQIDKAREEAFEKQEQQHMATLKTAEAAANTAKSIDEINITVVALRNDLDTERKERLNADNCHEVDINNAKTISRKADKKSNLSTIIALFALLVTILSNLDKMIANANIISSFIGKILQ